MKLKPKLGQGVAFLIVLTCVFCVSCNLPTTVPAPGNSIPQGYGEINVRFIAENDRTVQTRSVLDQAHSSALADSYELIATSDSQSQTTILTPGQDAVVRLLPGTYRIIALAGLKRSSTTSTCYLLGSGVQDSVSVIDGQRSSVDLVLKAVDFSLTTNGASEWGTSLHVVASGSTRNPSVGMLLDGTSTTAHPRFKSIELWNGYRDPSSTSGTPDTWTTDATVTIPLGSSAIAVQFVGASVCLLNGTGDWKTTSGLTQYDWKWMNRADLTDQNALSSLCEKKISASGPSTGINLSLRWE